MLLVLSVVLLVAAGLLTFLQLRPRKPTTMVAEPQEVVGDDGAVRRGGSIALPEDD